MGVDASGVQPVDVRSAERHRTMVAARQGIEGIRPARLSMSHPDVHHVGMCPICDGKSYEEVLHDLHHVVERFGWAVQGVEASRPWVYTIGLADRYGHPELVLAGVDISLSMNVLNALGTMVATGEELRPAGRVVVVGEMEMTFGAVHPVHLAAGLVGTWEGYYEWRPAPSPALEVVQVLPLPGRRFPLDQPHTTLDI